MRRRMLSAALFVAAFAAAAASVVTTAPEHPPSPLQFAVVMLAPILAALALTRASRWAYIAGACYAALAGLRSYIAPAGQVTLLNQLSTAAYLTLLIPIAVQTVRWIAKGRKKPVA